MADHPYKAFPDRQYWRRGLEGWAERRYDGLYRPRFEIDRATTRISAAGSCFAQHIGRQFKTRGYRYQDFEPAPAFLDPSHHADYGYGMFSCRYGNIYTARQMIQLASRTRRPSDDEHIWASGGRFYDAFRPSIEKGGFSTREEVVALRESHLRAVRRMFTASDVFVFTLGLTEVWLNRADGMAYPTCPGTVAGEFDPSQHIFHNLSYGEVLADMETLIRWARKRNPELKFLLTVSPVPLAATATDSHVVAATTYSKSILRAVAGELYQRHSFVDYFPSYEIVTAHPSQGLHFEAGFRDVSPSGVASVMNCFFAAHGEPDGGVAYPAARTPEPAEDAAMIHQMNVVCDEEKLDPDLAA